MGAMIPRSSKKLRPLPPLLPTQLAPLGLLPQLRPTQSAPSAEAGPHVSRKPPSLRQHPIHPGGPDHAAASLWLHRRSRVAPVNSSPPPGASVAASFQEQEEEEERLTGAPPRGPHGERVRVLMAAIQGKSVSASALPEECLVQWAHASRHRSCLHAQRERERERERGREGKRDIE